MYLIFYKTTDVFFAEEKFIAIGIKVKVVSTPVQDKAYCGICLKLGEEQSQLVECILDGVEYKIVE